MKLRRPIRVRKGRIEIIPMIDVMFFLLVTFMLASLSMQNLHSLPVNLPQGHAASLQTQHSITLTIDGNSHIFLDKTPVTLANLSAHLKSRMTPETDIIVAADSQAPNGVTIQAMLAARNAGAQHFLFAIKHVD
ncbi:MAG: biopolymer transporter ExbD [Betaproteobacteria bacterium]|jgi:outer membrane transport energization protein ExbD (TC 2.C.1.1.1)|nr:biopolymer transporter ExbD [Betaproteobacteria bacterium]